MLKQLYWYFNNLMCLAIYSGTTVPNSQIFDMEQNENEFETPGRGKQSLIKVD